MNHNSQILFSTYGYNEAAMSKKEIRLPDSELEVMQILWNKGSCTARDIREEILKLRGVDLAHGTIVTLIQRLEEKGHIKKTGKQIGKAFIYCAELKPDQAQKHFIRKYFNHTFGNDMVPLFSHLIEVGDLNLNDIKQIREMLNQQEEKIRVDKNE